jgi:hypothetical protein
LQKLLGDITLAAVATTYGLIYSSFFRIATTDCSTWQGGMTSLTDVPTACTAAMPQSEVLSKPKSRSGFATDIASV